MTAIQAYQCTKGHIETDYYTIFLDERKRCIVGENSDDARKECGAFVKQIPLYTEAEFAKGVIAIDKQYIQIIDRERQQAKQDIIDHVRIIKDSGLLVNGRRKKLTKTSTWHKILYAVQLELELEKKHGVK